MASSRQRYHDIDDCEYEEDDGYTASHHLTHALQRIDKVFAKGVLSLQEMGQLKVAYDIILNLSQVTARRDCK